MTTPEDAQQGPQKAKASVKLALAVGMCLFVFVTLVQVFKFIEIKPSGAKVRSFVDELGVSILVNPQSSGVLTKLQSERLAVLITDGASLKSKLDAAARSRDWKRIEELQRQIASSEIQTNNARTSLVNDLDGLINAERGQWNDAEKSFDLAISSDPYDKLAHFGKLAARLHNPKYDRANILLEQKTYSEKVRAEQSGMDSPFYWMATNNLGFVYGLEGNAKMATMYLEEFVTPKKISAPAFLQAYALHNLARTYEDLKDPRAMDTQKKAVAIFETLPMSDDKLNASALLASLEEDARDFDGAEKDITTVILLANSLHPNSYLLGSFYIIRASVRMHFREPNWLGGKEDTDQGLRLVPPGSQEAIGGHVYRAECLLNLPLPNNRKDAQKDLDTAIQIAKTADKDTLAFVRSEYKRLMPTGN